MILGNKTEVFMTMEMERYARAKEILNSEGIQYTVKTKSAGGHSAMSHRMGQFGEDMKYSITYYIFTRKEDAERARHFIQSGLNR